MKVGFFEIVKQVLYDVFRHCGPIMKWLKVIYDKLFDNRVKIKRNSIFRDNATAVLKAFTDCLDQNHIEYTLAFGSLLGAVREHGFIKHDLDIDVTIWYENNVGYIQSSLFDSGFRMIHCFSVDNDLSGREETYEKDGVTIDVFYLYKAISDHPYCCDFVKFSDSVDWRMSIYKHGGLLPRRIELPWTKERVRTDFESLSLFIPQNAHEILQMRYGSDYMTPNPNWENKLKHPYIINWTEKTAVFTVFHDE